LGSQRAATSRPGGSKAAKEDSRSASAREGAIYAQAAATRTMAAAKMKKAVLLEVDHNMLLLMTMPEDKITTVEAREYLRLRRGDELKKLRRKLAEEERERADAASAHEEGKCRLPTSSTCCTLGH
jgi:hypothetical protein